MRIHGRNGICYIAVNGPGGAFASGTQAATPMAFLTDWSINFTVDKVEVTSMGDATKIYVAGLPDASGDFSGFFDTATAQTYVAATDGLSRNFYLYPSTANISGQGAAPAQYFFGTILPDFSLTGGVGAAVGLKSSWSAATAITRYPPTGAGA